MLYCGFYDIDKIIAISSSIFFILVPTLLLIWLIKRGKNK